MEFRILGPLEIRLDGEQLPLARPRERRVLAALVVDAGRVVPLTRLVDAVWDARPPASAAKQVRNCVSALRQRLRAAGAPPTLITSEPAGYALRAAPGQVDVQRFAALVASGRRSAAAGAIEDAAARLREALALCRGPALAGLTGRVFEAAATGLDEQRLTVLEECLAHELARGRAVELVAELYPLVAEHPLRERLRGLLMRCLHRCGRRTEALQVYREGHRLLVAETGLEPGAELRDLQRAIVADDRPDRAEPPDGVRPPAQLPAPVPAFAGRDSDLAHLDAVLNRAGAAATVVAVTGTGGVGKTALAVHWAHHLRERYGDGQLYVNLRGYDPTPPLRTIEALALFLRALGVPAERLPVHVDEAAGMYRSLLAGRRVLVVLDNAADPEQVRPLLPGNPDCLVVVTSRDSMAGLVARDGAQVRALDVLAAPDAYALLAELIGDERVAAEPDATAQFARLCAHLPLALRIAAAHLAGRPRRRIGAYVSELAEGDRLSTLAIQGDPHTAVRAAFDLSYARLDPPARRLFRLLGVVPGPDVTVAAVAALAGVPRVDSARGLAVLAAAHLVEEPADGRFTFHDLLRQYAAELGRQEDGDEPRRAATERLYDWYVHLVDAAAGLLYPAILRLPGRPAPERVHDDHAAALGWLDAERRNLLAALTAAADSGPHRVAWLLADALRGYFHLRMHTVDWDYVAHAGASAADRDGEVAAQAAARLSLGDLHWRIGRYATAIEHYTRAAALAGRAGWPLGQVAVHGNLGNVYQQSGDLDRATTHYLAALRIAEQAGEVTAQGANLDNLGAVYWELGRLTEAADHLERAIEIASKHGSVFGEGISRTTLGEVRHAQGRGAEALEELTEALARHREVGNRGGEAETLRMLAVVHRDDGRLDQAFDLAEAALRLSREAGDRRYEADALNTLASLDHAAGRHRKAVTGYRAALALAREIGNTYSEVEALIGLAVADRRPGRPDAAGRHAEQALAVARRIGYRLLEARALAVISGRPQ